MSQRRTNVNIATESSRDASSGDKRISTDCTLRRWRWRQLYWPQLYCSSRPLAVAWSSVFFGGEKDRGHKVWCALWNWRITSGKISRPLNSLIENPPADVLRRSRRTVPATLNDAAAMSTIRKRRRSSSNWFHDEFLEFENSVRMTSSGCSRVITQLYASFETSSNLTKATIGRSLVTWSAFFRIRHTSRAI